MIHSLNHICKLRTAVKWLSVVALGIFVSCSKGEVITETLPADNGKIDMGVASVSSRALNPGGESGLTALQNSCSGTFPKNFKQSIRIWGTMAPNTNKTQLEPVFTNEQLIYDKQPNSHATQWNYKGPEKDKKNGYTYQFRAYYPGESTSSSTEQKMEYILGSNATKLMLKYNTINLQEDLLVSVAGNTSNVGFQFQHALAAMVFKFTSTMGEDWITSCWIENGETEYDLNDAHHSSGFFGSVGSMDYGNGNIDDLDNTINWKINWRYHESYRWEANLSKDTDGKVTAIDDGIRFDNTQEGLAYTPKTIKNEVPAKGERYINNEGALLIIPQRVTEDLFFCFTTRNNTQITQDGRPLKPVVMRATLHSKTAPEKVFEPGKKYIYNIKLIGSQVVTDLTIKDWNERVIPGQIEM